LYKNKIIIIFNPVRSAFGGYACELVKRGGFMENTEKEAKKRGRFEEKQIT